VRGNIHTNTAEGYSLLRNRADACYYCMIDNQFCMPKARTPMTKYSLIPAAFACSLLASIAVYAQAGKAPCGSFKKLPDGKWSVIKPVKIEHGSSSAMLNAGTTIGPGTHVTGVDMYAALEKNCH
jgi:hypothetical protein